MADEGPIAEQIGHLFQLFRRRYGLMGHHHALSSDSFRRPSVGGQMSLFHM